MPRGLIAVNTEISPCIAFGCMINYARVRAARSMRSQAVIHKAQSTRAGRSFAAAANFALVAPSVASQYSLPRG